MRRYAPAFVEAVALASKVRGDIVLARVHDVIGPNATIIDNTSNIYRASDVSEAVVAEGRRRHAEKVKEVIGVDSGPRAAAYSLLLSLSSHALSAMRELIGMPERVIYAAQRHARSFPLRRLRLWSFRLPLRGGCRPHPAFRRAPRGLYADRDHPRRLRYALCPAPADAADADSDLRRMPACPCRPCSRRGTTLRR